MRLCIAFFMFGNPFALIHLLNMKTMPWQCVFLCSVTPLHPLFLTHLSSNWNWWGNCKVLGFCITHCNPFPSTQNLWKLLCIVLLLSMKRLCVLDSSNIYDIMILQKLKTPCKACRGIAYTTNSCFYCCSQQVNLLSK